MFDAIPFQRRHIGPSPEQFKTILKFLNVSSLEQLVQETVPADIRQQKSLQAPAAMSETELLDKAKDIASKNKNFKSFIGMGYYGTHTPAVIRRSILENPGWYTAYTPYQPEISQGRLEALINFQTMITDLTGMDIANASLLDEGTAISEAVNMAYSIQRRKKKTVTLVSKLFPQSLEVLKTRCAPVGIDIEIVETEDQVQWDKTFAVVCQYPDAEGAIHNFESLFSKCKSEKCLSIVSADIMSLVVLKPPGEMGADIVVGSSQRFGVPMGFGGPHAAYIATKNVHKRLIPGRIVGVSKDSRGKPAYRLALQTREQHIRREKATSNICTAQVLLAVMAGMYGVFHGPRRLKQIAMGIHSKTVFLAKNLQSQGWSLLHQEFFDTIFIAVTDAQKQKLKALSESQGLNFNLYFENTVGISFDEVTTMADIHQVLGVFSGVKKSNDLSETFSEKELNSLPPALVRTSSFFQHPVFHRFRSETDLLRYITRLQRKDLTLANSMIPLGSCTMKLNAAAELEPVTWPEFANLHPFIPLNQAEGYLELIGELEHFLKEITGFAGISLQPNAGSQGEFAGLMAIRKYHQHNQQNRNICLIPSSAHGTNPASAVMAGMKVVIVSCDSQGNVDLEDLENKAKEFQDSLAALMITYPSTHGVFEVEIQKICKIIHDQGGQVYMDGANLNALVGLCQPGQFGPDVCHLNLHKTFCIPHGGGGPGVGPIGVAEHLLPYLPSHNLVPAAGPKTGTSNISAAPWGSALILPISWAYIRLMGADGLEQSTKAALMNANYIANRLDEHYKVLYRGHQGRIAHECIIDLRPIKETTGITVNDVAKRLMDFGFHAPTMSWPVINTMMIEPTESESLEEIDRFCEAMIQIRKEIKKLETKEWSSEDNPLVNAPHTISDLIEDWNHEYSKNEAFFPLPWVEEKKFWTSVNRIDNAYGDKNLFCSCIPVEEFSKENPLH